MFVGALCSHGFPGKLRVSWLAWLAAPPSALGCGHLPALPAVPARTTFFNLRIYELGNSSEMQILKIVCFGREVSRSLGRPSMDHGLWTPIRGRR
jgi:hypothetical protein